MPASPPRQANTTHQRSPALLRASLLQTGFLLLVACLLAYATDALHLQWSPPKALRELGVKEARARQAEIVWVDVRNPERFESAHIPGAIHFNEADAEAGTRAVRRYWTTGRKVCVYGEGIGSVRAERVAKLLKTALGSGEVYLLEGGWAAWPRE